MAEEVTAEAGGLVNEGRDTLRSDLLKCRHWLDRCAELSLKSDDADTRIGCIIVDPNGQVRSEGWNSLPYNIRRDASRLQRPTKYLWIEHAERNAIFHAAKAGVQIDGCTLFVSLLPCSECARGIIQAGIRNVVVSAEAMDAYEGAHYRESHSAACQMLSEAGVKVYRI